MNRDDRLRIAVFIDFDNIEIGVKNTLGGSFDAGLVLEALKERGDVVSKTAYSDWQRAGSYSRALTQHAIKMVQRNLTPGGDKNGADINLALDALEMAFTHPHINAFVIVGGDSDFISLVEKLKQYDKKVFVVGGRQFTSNIMQRNCHEFIAYENLVGATTTSGRRPAGSPGKPDRAPIEQAIPLVTRAIKVLSEREGPPPLGLLKTTLLQLDSTFSERTYGAGSFRDFAQKLERAGALKLHQARGGWFVGGADGSVAVGDAQTSSEDADVSMTSNGAEAIVSATPAPAQPSAAPNGQAGSAGSMADGLRVFRQILAAAEIRRWPMYLRNVKQIVRQAAPPLDERAYGFGSLVDLLRAAQREGIVRVERDRQGVIRVFQGSAAAAPATPAASAVDHGDAEQDVRIDDAGIVEVVEPPADLSAEDAQPFASERTAPAEAAQDGESDDQIAMLGDARREAGARDAEAPAPAAGSGRRPRRRRSPSGSSGSSGSASTGRPRRARQG